jgi:hypothetical protein
MAVIFGPDTIEPHGIGSRKIFREREQFVESIDNGLRITLILLPKALEQKIATLLGIQSHHFGTNFSCKMPMLEKNLGTTLPSFDKKINGMPRVYCCNPFSYCY